MGDEQDLPADPLPAVQHPDELGNAGLPPPPHLNSHW